MSMRTRTHFETQSVSLGVLGPIFTCETIFCIYRISEIQIWYRFVQKNAAMCTRTHFKTHSVYLCLGSNLDMWDHFLHLHNLRNPNLVSIIYRCRHLSLHLFLSLHFILLNSFKLSMLYGTLNLSGFIYIVGLLSVFCIYFLSVT